MKKTAIIILISISTILACKKSKTNIAEEKNNNTNPTDTTQTNPNLPPYYFTAKINGKEYILKATNLLKDNPSNPQELYLLGFQDFPNKIPSFQFILKKPAAGFHDGLSYLLDENDRQSFVNYTAENQSIFKSTATPAGDTTGVRLYFTKLPLDSGAVVEGRFSGILQMEESVQTVVITDGKFKVPVLN
jgi:hypothetical protein